jgi:DNA-binding NtrC family response regulator
LSEKEIIEQSLFHNSFSRTKTARELGISRVTLYNKMKNGLQE